MNQVSLQLILFLLFNLPLGEWFKFLSLVQSSHVHYLSMVVGIDIAFIYLQRFHISSKDRFTVSHRHIPLTA